ncbi:MAG: ergothioneine biosynthesis protein EgtB [Actinomycetota bacterium]
MDLKERIAVELQDARDRSLGLLAPISPDELTRQLHTLTSPLIWDLAHVGNYEEQWLLRAPFDAPPLVGKEFDEMYDPGLNPRRVRGALTLPAPEQSKAYVAQVRDEVLQSLWRADLSAPRPLLSKGYVYGMVIQHEHQHDETMLQTLSLRDRDYPVSTPGPRAAPAEPSDVFVEGGAFVMGTTDDPWAYDNERPAHAVELRSYWIDTTPVTNRAYLGFIEAGGYHEPRFWADEGWKWRLEAGLEAPEFWRRDGGGWTVRRFGTSIPLPLDEPVQHVCWYEADAFARWAGKRLPTEAEWEKAASWDPLLQQKRAYPWGNAFDDARANLGQRHFGPADAGAYPEGASFYGAQQMLGDVWEWCSSDFRAYPGFVAFPYPEYSAIHYGSDYKVLRGGSWATHPSAIRTTFRNWDYPIRRQIFAGFRCARDA